MAALYISIADGGNDGIVRRPRPADAIGAALRGTYEAREGIPPDLARLLERLDRTR